MTTCLPTWATKASTYLTWADPKKKEKRKRREKETKREENDAATKPSSAAAVVVVLSSCWQRRAILLNERARAIPAKGVRGQAFFPERHSVVPRAPEPGTDRQIPAIAASEPRAMTSRLPTALLQKGRLPPFPLSLSLLPPPTPYSVLFSSFANAASDIAVWPRRLPFSPALSCCVPLPLSCQRHQSSAWPVQTSPPRFPAQRLLLFPLDRLADDDAETTE